MRDKWNKETDTVICLPAHFHAPRTSCEMIWEITWAIRNCTVQLKKLPSSFGYWNHSLVPDGIEKQSLLVSRLSCRESTSWKVSGIPRPDHRNNENGCKFTKSNTHHIPLDGRTIILQEESLELAFVSRLLAEWSMRWCNRASYSNTPQLWVLVGQSPHSDPCLRYNWCWLPSQLEGTCDGPKHDPRCKYPSESNEFNIGEDLRQLKTQRLRVDAGYPANTQSRIAQPKGQDSLQTPGQIPGVLQHVEYRVCSQNAGNIETWENSWWHLLTSLGQLPLGNASSCKAGVKKTTKETEEHNRSRNCYCCDTRSSYTHQPHANQWHSVKSMKRIPVSCKLP